MASSGSRNRRAEALAQDKETLRVGAAALLSCVACYTPAGRKPVKALTRIITILFLYAALAGCQATRPIATNTISPTKVVDTPAAEDAQAKAFSLLRDNGGCRLPCFWGFTPGQTTEQTIIASLHPFSSIRENSSLVIPQGDLNASISLTWNYSDDPKATIKRMDIDLTVYRRMKFENAYEDRNVYDSALYQQYFEYYNLSHILSTYGLPSQAYVFLDVGIADMKQGIDLFILGLDYGKTGWVVNFEMPLRSEEGIYSGCPNQALTSLELWSPGDTETAMEYGFADTDMPRTTLEEATSMTLEEFYQKFKDPMNTQCLIISMTGFSSHE